MGKPKTETTETTTATKAARTRKPSPELAQLDAIAGDNGMKRAQFLKALTPILFTIHHTARAVAKKPTIEWLETVERNTTAMEIIAKQNQREIDELQKRIEDLKKPHASPVTAVNCQHNPQ